MKLFYILLFGSVGLKINVNASNKIKVACVGASITYGAMIENREQNSYPAQLQKMLGNKYQVSNYGVSGCTLLRKGDLPYWDTKEYKEVLAAAPDVVIIDLGGNDSKLINRSHLNEYESDYHELIKSFRILPSHPRIVLLLAMPSFVKDTTGVFDQVITKIVNPSIQQVAFNDKVEVIDMHSSFADKETIMPDGIHPNKEGAAIMARQVFENVIQKKDTGFNVFNNLEPGYKINSFYGYDCADFIFNGSQCKVVKPKWSAKGHPWIWRARFWGHEPQTDISLLQRGFHVVYCDVAELFGNDTAISKWNSFYLLLHNAGLCKKAVMEGMSRGGVYVFNWAAVNPKKVACVYVDNPVLDLKSWPAGMGRVPASMNEMNEFKEDYHLTGIDDIKQFKNSPIDKTEQIVKGNYPILILCADADEAVTPEENTLPFEKRIKALNGNITVMHKPGFKHHPHSFPNPRPITDFILKATGLYINQPEIKY